MTGKVTNIFSVDIAVANILVDSHVKQSGLLQDEAHARAQPANIELTYVDVVQVDGAAVHVVEAQQQR